MDSADASHQLDHQQGAGQRIPGGCVQQFGLARAQPRAFRVSGEITSTAPLEAGRQPLP